ncbi:MAG: SDR family oxidoreductase [Chloroflexi bacterium]|nr:SDR family oxidoreductase [Chloroflexota bacterium]OJV91905.1 MAG: hypothetical protein BGO39_14365 [Chloroflexi bacterium 54-19]
MRDLEGKLALVTGGGKGLGKVIATKLAERGAHVIINFFHSLEAAKQTRAELEATGAKVEVMRASVARKDQVDRMFNEIEEKFGYLDILVNNAASGAFVGTEGVTEDFFGRALDTNLKGSFWCARRAAPLMAKRGGGQIVNLSSMGAGQVIANYLVVGTSKAAVEALTRYLAVEYGPLNIRVNTASATLLEGDVAKLFPRYEEMKAASIAATPLGRIGTEDDLADLVMFLTSKQSRLITGQTILADGGLSLNSEGLAPPGERLVYARNLLASLNLNLNEAVDQPQAKPAADQALDKPQAAVPPTPKTATTPTAAVAPSTNGTSNNGIRGGGLNGLSPAQANGALKPFLATEAPFEAKLPLPVKADAEAADDNEEIAIVGMGMAFPGANNLEEYWQAMLTGKDLFSLVPEDRWDYKTFWSPDMAAEDKTYQGKSVFITDFEPEPALKTELQNERTDYEMTTLWLRHSLLQALKGVKQKEGDRISFAVGYTADGSPQLEEAQVLTGMLQRLESGLDAQGLAGPEKEKMLQEMAAALKKRYWRGVDSPSRFLPYAVGQNAIKGVLPGDTEVVMVDTACSSSMYAVDLGIMGLLMGKHDLAICGGAFGLAPRPGVLFAKLHGLSVGGEVRPLDKDSDGVLFSDGAGVVILKKLKRAQADGDNILAVIKAFGSSSDGKGKAIYAPSSAGQAIAVERTLQNPGVELKDIDWVVAHATGTPAGDSAEFKTLKEIYGKAERSIYLTSNKSLIGHTGWAAGVASIIQVVLGLQKGAIPPQHRFTATPAHFEIEKCSLKIPTKVTAWPSKAQGARAAAISGFGFGGTNAHMVIQEYLPQAKPAPKRKRAYQERVAIVGWSAYLPGLETNAEIESWLKGSGKGPQASFGEFYPLPPFDKVRMPPSTIRTIDRCQLMVLECAQRLRSQLGDFWENNKFKSGVLMGHMGQTRAATLYGLRSYLDDVKKELHANPYLAKSSRLEEVLATLTGEVRKLAPPANEDAFPGSMPNVIPARVTNYFDLKGLNITLDTGFSSTLTTFEMASRYLRSRELDMILVGGINGNSMEEMRVILRDLGVAGEPALAEGAFLFALTTEATARQNNLPILGFVGDLSLKKQAATGSENEIEAGFNHAAPNYLGAEGALAVLRALHSGKPETTISCRETATGPVTQLKIYAPTAAPDPKQAKAEAPATPAGMPERFKDTVEYAPGQPFQIKRYVPVLQEFPVEKVRPALPFLPPRTLLVTDRPQLLDKLGELPADLVVLSTAPFGPSLNGKSPSNRFYLPEINLEAVQQVLSPFKGRIKHLRVLADLGVSAPATESLSQETPDLTALHDLVFLALKENYDSLVGQESSFVELFLDAMPGATPHPMSGLFAGTLKSAMLELQGCLTFALFTDLKDAGEAARVAGSETANKHFIPVIYYRGNQRLTYFLDENRGTLRDNPAAVLDHNSVVVATAGARGITAELVKALAANFKPHLYLLGSNRLENYPPETFEGTDEEFARKRPEYLRREKLAHPEKTLGQLSKAYDRLIDARATYRNLRLMEQFCGKERVHYLACDVLDRAELSRTLNKIIKTHGWIDLLINAAGLSRSASIPLKSLGDFRAVRDIKIKGYQNLKYATRQNPPRMWCNFNSFIGLTGQLGETDYSAGNDFLSSAAVYSRSQTGTDEFSIGWGLWADVGLGATPMTKEYLEKQKLYTGMATEEGIHHFMRELHLPGREGFVTHLGISERKLITDIRPDFFEARQTWQEQGKLPATAASSTGPGFYLGRELSRTAEEVTFERVFDLDKDSYLDHHVVNGYATLPGTFVPEIATEVASQLVPDLKVIALEDAVFHHFLRVYDKTKPGVKKIQARLIERSADRALVQVKVMTDVIGPKGIVLTRDKLHFEIKVVMSREVPEAPSWEAWSPANEQPVPDPYHFPAAPVLLTDMFVSTTDTRLNPLGKRATYKLRVAPDDPTFSQFRLPSILLDGLARVQVLNFVLEDYIPLVAPASIRRIDIYEAVNDCQLSQKYERIDMYATPRELDFGRERGGNRCVAVRPDGKIILQLKDMTGVIMGYVHRHTGEFVTREKIDEMQRTSTASRS